MLTSLSTRRVRNPLLRSQAMTQTNVRPLFDNLVNLEGLRDALERELGRRYSRSTIERWIKDGMPVERLRTRERFFRPGDVATWLQRTS